MRIAYHLMLLGQLLLEAGCIKRSLAPSTAVFSIGAEYLRHPACSELDRGVMVTQVMAAGLLMDKRLDFSLDTIG